MLIYILIFCYLIFTFWVIDIKKKKRWKNLHILIIYLIFVLFSGLRYKIGGDTFGYMNEWPLYSSFFNFNWVDDIIKMKTTHPDLGRYQPGWILYVMFCKGICNNFYFFQIVTASIINYAIIKTILKYSVFPFITIFIYASTFTFFLFEFEIMREALAISVFLLCAYDSFVSKKWVKFYLGTLIAFSVHYSVLLMFLLPFFRNINLSVTKLTLYIYLPSLIIAVTGRQFLGDTLNLFLGGNDFVSNYTYNVINRETNFNYTLMYIYHPTILFLITIIFHKYINRQYYLALLFLTISVSNFSALYYTVNRLCNYIIIIDYIAITPIIYNIIKRYNSIIPALIIMGIYFIPEIYTFKNSIDGYSKYFPYQSIISEEQTKEQRDRVLYYKPQ